MQAGSDYIKEVMDGANDKASDVAGPRSISRELESQLFVDIPPQYWARIERATFTAVSIVPACRNWKMVQSFDGLTIRTAQSSNHFLSAFGEICLDYSTTEIFSVIVDPRYASVLHGRQKVHEITACFSTHSWFEYIAYDQPLVSGRDFSVMVHWRLLDDGTIVIVYFSDVLDEFPETIEGFVRCKVVLSAVLISPLVVDQSTSTPDRNVASVGSGDETVVSTIGLVSPQTNNDNAASLSLSNDLNGDGSNIGSKCNRCTSRVSYLVKSDLRGGMTELFMNDIAVDTISMLLRLKSILANKTRSAEPCTRGLFVL